MTDEIDDIYQIEGVVFMNDDYETLIKCDDVEYTKDELWDIIKIHEMWDITITLKDEYE